MSTGLKPFDESCGTRNDCPGDQVCGWTGDGGIDSSPVIICVEPTDSICRRYGCDICGAPRIISTGPCQKRVEKQMVMDVPNECQTRNDCPGDQVCQRKSSGLRSLSAIC